MAIWRSKSPPFILVIVFKIILWRSKFVLIFLLNISIFLIAFDIARYNFSHLICAHPKYSQKSSHFIYLFDERWKDNIVTKTSLNVYFYIFMFLSSPQSLYRLLFIIIKHICQLSGRVWYCTVLLYVIVFFGGFSIFWLLVMVTSSCFYFLLSLPNP